MEPNGHKFTIAVDQMPGFGEFEEGVFTFKGAKEEDVGKYEIVVSLIDEK